MNVCERPRCTLLLVALFWLLGCNRGANSSRPEIENGAASWLDEGPSNSNTNECIATTGSDQKEGGDADFGASVFVAPSEIYTSTTEETVAQQKRKLEIVPGKLRLKRTKLGETDEYPCAEDYTDVSKHPDMQATLEGYVLDNYAFRDPYGTPEGQEREPAVIAFVRCIDVGYLIDLKNERLLKIDIPYLGGGFAASDDYVAVTSWVKGALVQDIHVIDRRHLEEYIAVDARYWFRSLSSITHGFVDPGTTLDPFTIEGWTKNTLSFRWHCCGTYESYQYTPDGDEHGVFLQKNHKDKFAR